MHYRDITDAILRSDLTGLSEGGGQTPAQTVGASMRAHPEMFAHDSLAGKGYYSLSDASIASASPAVLAATKALAACSM